MSLESILPSRDIGFDLRYIVALMPTPPRPEKVPAELVEGVEQTFRFHRGYLTIASLIQSTM